MAEVFLARTTGIEGFERYIVIKQIRAEQARDAQHVRMFLDEARLAAALHHHNIVQVHDVGEAHGEYFFAMEYVHGKDVQKLLERAHSLDERVPLEHVLTIMTAAAAGLHHAHEQRDADRNSLHIVHRDVSPANILIGFDGSVKVTDFGVAKAAHQTARTQSGVLKGKVAYMSPEQCNSSTIDRRSDVFALGIVLYELVTTRHLFAADNDFLTMTQIVRGGVHPPSIYWPEIPVALERIIMKALSLSPDDRYATADDFRRARSASSSRSRCPRRTGGAW
jgi:serine/threonine protein kinase